MNKSKIIIPHTTLFGQKYIKLAFNFLLLMIYMFFMASCASVPKMRAVTDKSKIPFVKILIYKDPSEITIKSNQKFLIFNGNRSTQFDDSTVSFKMTDSVISIRDSLVNESITDGFFELVPTSGNNRFALLGNTYRGKLTVLRLDGGLAVINALDLESYLMGVVRNEIGRTPKEMIEAAKAQAVAARTYAVKNFGKYKGAYDFASDVSDQVYKGASSETDVTNRAVEETSGEVLTYNGKTANALYFSSCGGVTANAMDVWGGSDTASYLRSIADYIGGHIQCDSAPHYRWTLTWTGEEIEQTIKNNIAAVLQKSMPGEDFSKIMNQKLYNLAILERDASQRVKTLKIGFTRDAYTVTGEQARRILKGASYILYSSLFRIDIIRHADGTIKTVECKGAGFGHGVGMCQWGARRMAQDGYSYEQILKFFYRGTDIRRLY